MPTYTKATYMSSVDIDVATLTTGTVYYSFFNTHTHNIHVTKCILQTMSATGSGNSRSVFGLARAKGTVPSGGTVVSCSKNATDTPSISVDVRASGTGITTTGITIEPYFLEIAIRTGSDGHTLTYTFDGDLGFTLAPTEGIVIRADGAMIAGAALHECLEYYTRV